MCSLHGYVLQGTEFESWRVAWLCVLQGTEFESRCVARLCVLQGTEFESRCVATCLARGWVVKGGEPYVTCLDTGHWDSPTIFCGPANKAPLNVSMQQTVVVSVEG